MYTENNRDANQKYEYYIDDDEEIDYFDKLYKK